MRPVPGIAAEYTDEDYEKAGAKVTSRDEVLAEADALGFVDRPSAETVAKLRAGQWVIGMLGSFTDADYMAALEKAGLVGIAIEKLPRKLSSAQSMDEMTSQELREGLTRQPSPPPMLTVPSCR